MAIISRAICWLFINNLEENKANFNGYSVIATANWRYIKRIFAYDPWENGIAFLSFVSADWSPECEAEH